MFYIVIHRGMLLLQYSFCSFFLRLFLNICLALIKSRSVFEALLDGCIFAPSLNNRKNYLNWVFSFSSISITYLRCPSPHILRLRPSHLQHVVRIFALVDRSMILSWDLISFMARRGLLLKLGGSLTNSFFFNIFNNTLINDTNYKMALIIIATTYYCIDYDYYDNDLWLYIVM